MDVFKKKEMVRMMENGRERADALYLKAWRTKMVQIWQD